MMDRPRIGRVILVVEDASLIAFDIQQAFEAAGARTIAGHTAAASLRAADEPNLSAAIVDHALGDRDSSEICERLTERSIPFMTYSGFTDLDGPCRDVVRVGKPASAAMLVATVMGLLKGQPISN